MRESAWMLLGGRSFAGGGPNNSVALSLGRRTEYWRELSRLVALMLLCASVERCVQNASQPCCVASTADERMRCSEDQNDRTSRAR